MNTLTDSDMLEIIGLRYRKVMKLPWHARSDISLTVY